MGIASVYLDDDDLFVVVWDGPLTGDEWMGAVQLQATADPQWPVHLRRLLDLTTMDSSALRAADFEKAGAFVSEKLGDISDRRLAIVGDLDPETAANLSRFLSQLGPTAIVFPDLASACAWLSVDAGFAHEVVSELRNELREQ